ncbi:hypothetical protein SNE40_001698 [Patella caerulea]|uniref:Chitin-binding type-2 domain-containing protein n=1 Tax=Patella caerulea TaxID=87958 RepID=A0AAN8JZN6_PATCE
MKLNMDQTSVFITLVIILGCHRVQSVITGGATCDDTMSFYADGVLYTNQNDNDWRQQSPVSIPDDTRVVAIKCLNIRGIGGIKMALGDGTKTDVTWKCSAAFEDNWNKVGFNDAAWANAIVPPYNTVKTQPESLNGKADWIWTSGYEEEQDTTVYCRKVIKNPCALRRRKYFAYPFDDTKFYQCDNMVAKLRDCAPSTVWQQSRRTCVHVSEPDSGCINRRITADPDDCTKFYHCAKGERIGDPMSCAPGTVFNKNKNRCDFPRNVPGCP